MVVNLIHCESILALDADYFALDVAHGNIVGLSRS